MAEVQVCLASDQRLANVIPVLMRRPSVVHVVASDEKRDSAKALERFLVGRGFEVRVHAHAPDFDAERILAYAEDLALALDEAHPDASIVLNATGGNKLMALGFVQAFRAAGAQVLYTDTQHGRIEFIDESEAPLVMEEVLDVPTYLDVQGMTYRHAQSDDSGWRQRASSRKSVTKYLASHARALGPFIGALNGLVHGDGWEPGALSGDGARLDNPNREFTRPPQDAWKAAMQIIAEAELVEWSGGVKVGFTDAESAAYLGGLWLEEYAWHTAVDNSDGDVRCSVKGTWRGTAKRNAPRNEFDLLVVARNRMLVVECKTLRLDRDREQEKGQAIVNKLESLGRNAGGLFGQTLLLSARPVEDHIRNRCRSLNIPLRDGAGISRLGADIRGWLASGHIAP